MSILDIKDISQKNNIIKTIYIYMALTLISLAVNKIYSLFGHGVSSDAMTWMFLYPLIGGSIFYLIIKLAFPYIYQFNGYRAFYNIYNSGIATLTVGSFLKGILEIAGTNSSYTKIFSLTGWIFTSLGLIFLIIMAVNHKRLICVKQ